MRYVFRFLLFPILILAAIAILIEVGFGLRSAYSGSPILRGQPTAAVRVLFIGDSILGFNSQSTSIAGRLTRMLQKEDPSVAVSEISRPGQTTAELQPVLLERLEEFRPTVTVMMIGKADFGTKVFVPEWLHNLRLYRLWTAASQDLRTRMRGAGVVPPKNSHDTLFDPAWKAMEKSQFEEAIKLFEAGLSVHPSYENGIRALFVCYLETRSYDRGEHFFNHLAEKSKLSVLAKTFGQALRLDEHSKDNKKRALIIENIERQLEGSLDHRGSLKTRLWVEKKNGDGAKFRKIFAEMKYDASRKLLDSTTDNLHRMIDQIDAVGSKILILQYPLDRAEVLRAALSSRTDRITLLEPREWLLEDKSHETIEYIDQDIEHVTELGAEVIARKLSLRPEFKSP